MFDNNLWTMEPVGREENTVQGKTYRFTLLTPCLIRMEYREDGQFEDRPTQSLSLIHISETTRLLRRSRMPSSA